MRMARLQGSLRQREGTQLVSYFIFPFSGWRGEAEIEKGPVDLFPTEPTDEGTLYRGDLEARASRISSVQKRE